MGFRPGGQHAICNLPMRTFVISSALLLLGACSLPEPSPNNIQQPGISNQQLTQTGGSIEVESDTEGLSDVHVIEPQSFTGSEISERLLPSGMLEIGNREAPHTIMLITEHHCDYCRDFLIEHIPVLEKEYIAKGMLRLSIAILPLKKYAGSSDASAALFCAGRQGKGWPIHLLLSNRTSMDRSSLLSYARELKIDEKTFGECLADPVTLEMQSTQHAWLRSLGVTEVPTYFIDGKRYTGLPYAADLEGQLSEIMEE
jgi:protein-disulfide isomerase